MPSMVDAVFGSADLKLVCVPFTAFDPTGETVLVSEVAGQVSSPLSHPESHEKHSLASLAAQR